MAGSVMKATISVQPHDNHDNSHCTSCVYVVVNDPIWWCATLWNVWVLDKMAESVVKYSYIQYS